MTEHHFWRTLGKLPLVMLVWGLFKKPWHIVKGLAKHRRGRWVLPLAILLIGLQWPLTPENPDLQSRVLFDRHGELLRVWLNAQQQYRLGAEDSLDPKYRKCVEAFEDQRFAWHPGIDPLAVLRAAWQNTQAGHVQSGASTLTMQVVRLKNPTARTYTAKFLEAWGALRLEWHWSKERIFAEYAAWVPMGSNIVGASTASWKFFGHSPHKLTWSEAALLAILPNQPSSLYLEKGRQALLTKRNRLLQRMVEQGQMPSEFLESSLAEPLPRQGRSFHFAAPHYADWVAHQSSQKWIWGTLDLGMQRTCESLLKTHLAQLRIFGVHNAAILVMETSTGKIRAYVGSQGWNDTAGIGRNDGVLQARSTGSLLKPFLYALSIQKGPWNAKSMLLDVPTQYPGFRPLNADEKYAGLVTMQEALVRSLNVPAVRMLKDYGLDEFYWWLKQASLKHLFRTPQGYGLPLILGGAEAALVEMVPLYAMLLREGQWKAAQGIEGEENPDKKILQAGSAWATLEMLKQLKRPDLDEFQEWLTSTVPVAWKTGTSFGARDAWAVGGNAQWTIGVWVGNFQGGSIDGISGARSAAPILFNLFNALTDRKARVWPLAPAHDLQRIAVCALSGDRAGEACPKLDSTWVPMGDRTMHTCSFHHRVLVDHQNHEVCSRCWNPHDTHWVVQTLIPAAARPFMHLADTLQNLAHKATCPALFPRKELNLVYPVAESRIFLPRDYQGKRISFLAQAEDGDSSQELWWFLDGQLLGKTKEPHEIPVNAGQGSHLLVVQDQRGEAKKVRFYIAHR